MTGEEGVIGVRRKGRVGGREDRARKEGGKGKKKGREWESRPHDHF